MPRVFRRLLALASLFVALGVGWAVAAEPGPRLAVVKLKTSERTELFTTDALGGSKSVLLAASASEVPAVYPFSGPSWSPDGTRLAFTALIGQRSDLFTSSPHTMLGLIGADGGRAEPIPSTDGGYGAVFSPDGGSIAYARDLRRRRPSGRGFFESSSIWLVDLASGKSRQLTPWRDGLFQIPSSFSPDGAQLGFTRIRGGKERDAMAMELNGSAATVLARNALEPVFSPDGGKVAFLRGPVKKIVRRVKGKKHSSVSVRALLSDIFVSSATGLRRITHTERTPEITPRWDPSGQRIAYTLWRPLESDLSDLFGFGDAVMQVNADGTCPTRILSERRSVHYAATWQPGPGREAGPIAC